MAEQLCLHRFRNSRTTPNRSLRVRKIGRSIDQLVRPAGHVFYGWWIAGASSGLQWLAAMLWMQSYGAYVVLLQADFGWSKTVMAAAFAMTRIESGILGPAQGWLVDRFGPRLILTIGTLIFGVGFMLFSQVESLLGFYLIFALIALGSSLGGLATLMVSLVNWFNRHRAKAVSLSQLGFSVGGLSVPLVILSLEAFGWRATAFYSGILVLILGLPLVRLVHHRPEDRGEVPDGIRSALTNGETPPQSAPDFTARQAMRTWPFWLISFGHAFALLAVSSLIVHLAPHLTEGMGYSLAAAGLVVALMTGCQMVGQLIGGYLGDKLDKRLICFACMLAHSVGMLLLAYATHFWMVVLFTLLHGLAWGVRGPQMVALRADYFGASSFGTIMGFSSLIVMLGMSAGPIFAGYMADRNGDYQAGFTLLAALVLVGAFCFLLARPPKLAGRSLESRSP
ncbi:MAG: MFS transporter [Gammaproteobacteria bacterium]|nr:MFS transporter [Gammaproteobacteria bacterium]MYE85872.1 MFS transporter [Gammaproteobacteria bacterium]